jgi:hypothetical protein
MVYVFGVSWLLDLAKLFGGIRSIAMGKVGVQGFMLVVS